MARGLSAAVCVLIFAVQAQPPRDASSPNPETGSITGRVVSAETGDPVRKARVILEAGSGRVPPVFSDANGRFVFTGLAPAKYALTVSTPGFVRSSG
jgi:hypothetical protein